MSDAAKSKCSMCGKPAGPRPENQAFPFCSERCRMADLGRWLDEDYRIPDGVDVSGGGTEGVPAAGEEPDRD